MSEALAGVFRSAAGLAVVAAAGLYATADAGTRFVYQRGAYTADDASVTASLVAILAFAVPGWALYTVALRTVHAAERMWLSSLIGALTLLPSWFVYQALGRSSGVVGIAVATGICVTGATLAMLAASHATWRRSPWSATLRGLLEGAIVGAVAGGGALLADRAASSLPVAARFVAVAAAFSILALPGLLFLGGPAADAVRRRLARFRAR